MKTTRTQNAFRILLGLMMIFPGIAHLTYRRTEFQALVPRWLPDNPAFLDFVVISSGIVEIVFGLALILLSRHKTKIGIALAIFYVLVLFGNISQYSNGIDAFGLDTDQKRLVRLFFQPLLIFWSLWSTGGFSSLLNKNTLKN